MHFFFFITECKKPSRDQIETLKREIQSFKTPRKTRQQRRAKKEINFWGRDEEYVCLLRFLEKRGEDLPVYWQENMSQDKSIQVDLETYNDFMLFKKKLTKKEKLMHTKYFHLTPWFLMFIQLFKGWDILGYVSSKLIIEESRHVFKDLWFHPSGAIVYARKAYNEWISSL